jgi:hypothetical protein
MTETQARRVLVVANRTESAPRLLDEVGHRARAGCQFALIVPPERHPDAPDWTPEEALRLVQRAAGDQPVTLVDCGEDAAATIGELVERGECARSCSPQRPSTTNTGTATRFPSASRTLAFQ